MDKFFYRLTVQTVIKAICTAFISVFCTAIIYTIFASVIAPISAVFDYWLQMVVGILITIVTCFMIITVKDDYGSIDISTTLVGHFWATRAYDRKKFGWFRLEIIMLPLFIIAAVLGYMTYTTHETILEVYRVIYAPGNMDATIALEVYLKNIEHFLMPILAIFFFAQWRHVRNFAKEGRCPKCHAAFALDFHRNLGVETQHSTKITKKARSVVAGANYLVTKDGDEEISRTKIGDVYETVYDKYKTNTTTTFSNSAYRCAFCGYLAHKTDVHTTYNTTKL